MCLLPLWTFLHLVFQLSVRVASRVRIQVGIIIKNMVWLYVNKYRNMFVTAEKYLHIFVAPSDDDDEVVAMIKELLDTRIR